MDHANQGIAYVRRDGKEVSVLFEFVIPVVLRMECALMELVYAQMVLLTYF